MTRAGIALLCGLIMVLALPGNARAATETDWVTFPTFWVAPTGNPIQMEELEKAGIDAQAKILKSRMKIVVPDGPGPFPVVLVFHGCGGADPYDQSNNWWQWRDHYVKRGYVAAVVDSFTPRQVDRICSGAVSLRLSAPIFFSRIGDAYGALDYLVKNRARFKVDPGRIFALGGSHGGGLVLAVMSTHVLRQLRHRLGHGYAFAGGMSLYPACVGRRPAFYNPVTASVGELDDWTPPAACYRWRDGPAPKGSAPFELHVMKGATHSFDNWIPGRVDTSSTGYAQVYSAEATRKTQALFDAFAARNGDGRGRITRIPAYATADEIRKALTGSILTDEAASQLGTRSVHFEAGGHATMKFSAMPGGGRKITWRADDIEGFCMTIVGEKYGVCSQLQIEGRRVAWYDRYGVEIGRGRIRPGTGSAGVGGQAGPGPPRWLGETEIRSLVVGNTLYFVSFANGRTVFLYFDPDGSVAVKSAARPDRTGRQTWFFKEGGVLCRKIRNRGTPCVKIRRAERRDEVIIAIRQRMTGARILKGRQLSKQAMADAPKTFPEARMAARSGRGPGQDPRGGRSPSGRQAGGRPDPQTIVRRLDRDGDGRLSSDEFRGPPKIFKKIDADHDGFVSLEELTRARAKGGKSGAPNSPGERFVAKIVKRFDSDGDKVLSGQEAAVAAKKGMKLLRFDANGDGRLTHREISQGWRKIYRDAM